MLLARATLNPMLHSALTMKDYATLDGDLDINALVDAFEDQVNLIADGNLQNLEAMLLAEAHTLHMISNYLLRRSMTQEYMRQLETFLKLGLKAQSQCRATLATLADILKPDPVSTRAAIMVLPCK